MPDDILLKVNGKVYAGAKSLQVVRQIDAIAGTFSFTYTDRWVWEGQQHTINPGDACTVTLGSSLLLTGYVDDVAADFDKDSHELTVNGRSKTADLVDCSAIKAGGQWSSATLLKIAQDLCGHFGISVIAQVNLGGPLVGFTIQEGESIHECLERAARMRGVLLVASSKGELLLTRAGTTSLGDAKLETGVNILKGSVSRSEKERFTRYTVKGQASGNDDAFGSEAAHIQATVIDNTVSRTRPLVIIAEGDATLANVRQRALWEMNNRRGRSRKAQYTVPGWTYDGTHPWEINKLVRVLDGIGGVGETLLISEVAFARDTSGGTVTQLSLSVPTAYSVEPLSDVPKPKKGAGGLPTL